MSWQQASGMALESQDATGYVTTLAIVASVLICLIIYRVKMRHCESVLKETARTIEDVRRTTEALQTNRRVIKAAALTAEKTLREYNALLAMLHKMREGEYNQPDPRLPLPALRHQLEVETMRAQVGMVQGCVMAMSEELLLLPPAPQQLGDFPSSEQNGALASLYNHGKSLMSMSEEILALLDKHKDSVNSHTSPGT